MPPGRAGVDGPAPAAACPDPLLVAAAALVFVADPAAPVVEDADVRHLLDVLRLRPGEPVVAADGAGRWVPCRIAASVPAKGSRGADPTGLLVPDGPAVAEERLRPEVTVAFAPTKGDRPEWVTQKLTELGVDRIVPLRTSRSVVRWEGERAVRSVERLRRVAREAASQCRRARLPEIADVCRLEDLAGVAGAPVALADAGGGPGPRPAGAGRRSRGRVGSGRARRVRGRPWAWAPPCCGRRRPPSPPGHSCVRCAVAWYYPLRNHAPW